MNFWNQITTLDSTYWGMTQSCQGVEEFAKLFEDEFTYFFTYITDRMF